MRVNEIEDNGYVLYMHKHKHCTTEDGKFGDTFNVWDINKLFPNGNAKNWREVVGDIEEERFGVNMANAVPDTPFSKDEIRQYLTLKKKDIDKEILSESDGYIEERRGMDYKSIGKDREALVQFYISIGKGFNAPALYYETVSLLQKYEMYEEELDVIEISIKNALLDEQGIADMNEKKNEVLKLINSF